VKSFHDLVEYVIPEVNIFGKIITVIGLGTNKWKKYYGELVNPAGNEAVIETLARLLSFYSKSNLVEKTTFII